MINLSAASAPACISLLHTFHRVAAEGREGRCAYAAALNTARHFGALNVQVSTQSRMLAL